MRSEDLSDAAILALRDGRLSDAVTAATNAVIVAPDGFECRLLLAEALYRSGEFARAITHYELTATLAPDDLRVRLGLAKVYAAVGLFDEAASACRTVLEADPSSETARSLLTMALSRRLPQLSGESRSMAQRLFQEAERLEAKGQAAQALAAFAQVARYVPGAAPVYYRMGCLLQDLGGGEAALSHYELAARLQSDHFAAAHNAGKLAASFGAVERARRYLSQAGRLRPQDGISMRLAVLTDALHDSPESIASARAQFEHGLDSIIAAPPRIDDPLNKADVPTFYLAYHGLCNRGLNSKLARAFEVSVPELTWQARHCGESRRRPGRIRIGFISQFIRSHSIGKVARGLIAELNRELFEVYVLNIPPTVQDDTTRWIQARCDRWVILADKLPAARAEIAALELDILFYQDIGMEPFSYLLAFARLAKVQCVSFGHPDTTGIPNMDYYVSNDLYERPGASEDYSERLFELRNLPTLAFYPRPAAPQTWPTRAELGLSTAVRLYVCSQTLFKLHPDFDDVIGRILELDGNGRVLLFSGACEEWSVKIQRRFRRTIPGVADRIQFLPRQPYARYLQLVNTADVILDTLHFNGMTTSMEAFSVAAPVITLPGALQRGRVTQAMYRSMGIDDAVAATVEEYANLAVGIGMNTERRQALRELIAERSHLLFEDRRAVDEFQRFFLAAHLEATGQSSG